MKEEFRVIENSNYSISNKGVLKTSNWKNKSKDAIMKPALNRKGYLKTILVLNSVNKPVFIHRLVAMAFIPNPENKPQVNHINGIKTDNRVENLEWVTAKENVNHAIQNGLIKSVAGWNKGLNTSQGSENVNSILDEKKVIEIRLKFVPRRYTRKMLAYEYGVKESTIKDVLIRKSWRHI